MLSLSLGLKPHQTLIGPNLVVNGDFAEGVTTGWTAAGSGTLDASGFQLLITNGAAAEGRAEQVISVIAGARYSFVIDRKESTGSSGAVGVSGGPTFEDATNRKSLSAGVNTYFVTTGVSTSITLRIFTNSATAGHSVTVDDIKLRRIW